MTLELRDRSTWNQVDDWNAVATSGCSGVLAKASEGNGFEDPSWRDSVAALLAPGPLIGGSYHFLRPDLGNDPIDEADWYLSRHPAACFDPQMPWIFALDAESSGGSNAGCQAFLGRVQARTGYPCWTYSYANWIETRGVLAPTSPLWLAWPDSNGPDAPLLGWPVITMQQYGTASVPGMVGQIDANRFFGDLSQLRILAGVTAGPPPSPPQEDNMLLVKGADADTVYLLSGSMFAAVDDADDLAVFEAQGIKLVTVSPAMIKTMLGSSASSAKVTAAGSLAVNGTLAVSS